VASDPVETPEISLIIVRVESIEIAVAVDGRASWLAPLERGEHAVSGGHPSLFKSPCCLL
jgi:hypothetical protein